MFYLWFLCSSCGFGTSPIRQYVTLPGIYYILFCTNFARKWEPTGRKTTRLWTATAVALRPLQAGYTGPDGKLHKAAREPTPSKRRYRLAQFRTPQNRPWHLGRGRTLRRRDAARLRRQMDRAAGAAARTRAHYESMLKRLILPELGDAKIVTLTPAKIREWHTGLDGQPTRNAHATRCCTRSARPPSKMKCSTPTRAVSGPPCRRSAVATSTCSPPPKSTGLPSRCRPVTRQRATRGVVRSAMGGDVRASRGDVAAISAYCGCAAPSPTARAIRRRGAENSRRCARRGGPPAHPPNAEGPPEKICGRARRIASVLPPTTAPICGRNGTALLGEGASSDRQTEPACSRPTPCWRCLRRPIWCYDS